MVTPELVAPPAATDDAADPKPGDLVTLDEVCAADSPYLLREGFTFDLCHRRPGHPGFHHFIAL